MPITDCKSLGVFFRLLYVFILPNIQTTEKMLLLDEKKAVAPAVKHFTELTSSPWPGKVCLKLSAWNIPGDV